MDSDFWKGVSAILFVLLVFVSLVLGITDISNPGEICVERNFYASFHSGPNEFYCARETESGKWEVRPVDWVKANCGDTGACADE